MKLKGCTHISEEQARPAAPPRASVRICVDFDGTIVKQDRPYEDVVTPLEFVDGAKEALVSLRRAGHLLILWSGRSSRSLLYDPDLDPLVRAGAVPSNRKEWLTSRHLHRARYEQMVEFVNRELPSVFDAIDDGLGGKPACDLFVDDRGATMRGPATWARIARQYGETEPLFDDPLPALLDTPVARLNLVPTGQLKGILDKVRGELRADGIVHYEPIFALGDSGFWCADRAITINLPWFLATPELYELAQARYPMRWEDVARGVRHEVGHAVNYSFELWKRPDWTATFGDFEQPYPKTTGSWPILPAEDFVEYVQDSGPHYAMKHADESWAEAFAAWLDTEFDVSGLRAGARRKLEYVDRIAREVLTGWPTNYEVGVPKEWREAYSGQLVRQALGIPIDVPDIISRISRVDAESLAERS
jgi:hypothetical protein